MHHKLLFFIVLLCIASSCTTILNMPTKKIHVYATQENAYATYKDSTYKCPTYIEVPRSYNGDTIYVSHEEKTDTVFLRPIISPVYLYNYMFYGIGYLVDPFTPKVTTYNQPLFLDFSKNEIVSTWRKPRVGSTIFSIQCPSFYSFISNPTSQMGIGAFEFRIDQYVATNMSFYMKGSQFSRKQKFSVLRAEFGIHTIVREQFGLSLGAFMGHFALEPRVRNSFWGGTFNTPEINSNIAGISLEAQRFLIRGFYSFLSYNCGYAPTHKLYVHMLECGYGIRINLDFIKVKRH